MRLCSAEKWAYVLGIECGVKIFPPYLSDSDDTFLACTYTPEFIWKDCRKS